MTRYRPNAAQMTGGASHPVWHLNKTPERLLPPMNMPLRECCVMLLMPRKMGQQAMRRLMKHSSPGQIRTH